MVATPTRNASPASTNHRFPFFALHRTTSTNHRFPFFALHRTTPREQHPPRKNWIDVLNGGDRREVVRSSSRQVSRAAELWRTLVAVTSHLLNRDAVKEAKNESCLAIASILDINIDFAAAFKIENCLWIVLQIISLFRKKREWRTNYLRCYLKLMHNSSKAYKSESIISS